jgi:prepilin peptidase CpaA
MLTTVLLLGLVLAAAVTDLREHKIYNSITYPGIICALCLSGLGSLLAAAGLVDESLLKSWGCISLADSVFGLLACGVPMLVCMIFFDISGGDIKLIAMMGAFLGVQDGITAMLWTFVFGACLALFIMIWSVGQRRLLLHVLRHFLWTLRLGRHSGLSEEEREILKMPLFLAPCAAAAVAVVRFSLVDFIM